MSREHTPTPAHSSSATTPRELDSRASDGIQVQLLWNPVDGHVSVAVYDTKTSEAFEVEVSNGQRVLDVFHHPYAYAAEPGGITHEETPAAATRRPLPL